MHGKQKHFKVCGSWQSRLSFSATSTNAKNMNIGNTKNFWYFIKYFWICFRGYKLLHDPSPPPKTLSPRNSLLNLRPWSLAPRLLLAAKGRSPRWRQGSRLKFVRAWPCATMRVHRPFIYNLTSSEAATRSVLRAEIDGTQCSVRTHTRTPTHARTHTHAYARARPHIYALGRYLPHAYSSVSFGDDSSYYSGGL